MLVVDAPTDWSLAGPLWELALDDAPVDEILDVLVRRGIRTAPSFAIVRVEVDAVRALVRGSVPVCFERAGEPVRLDATGATTWLEGLISGARRVLVGDVESSTELPFTVSTGVVLVSGLALNCTPVASDAETPAVVSEAPAVAALPAAPEAAEELTPESAPLSLAGAPGAERVVDLTEGESRTPAYSGAPGIEAREGWSALPSRTGGTGGFPREVNGHVPSVLDSPASGTPQPSSSGPVPAPSSFFDSRSGSDDPGELHDVDDLAGGSSDERPDDSPSENDGEQARSFDFDDLLTDDSAQAPAEPELPALPQRDPGSSDVPSLNGHGPGVPPKPRPGGVPAGWPPVSDEPEPFTAFRSEPSAPDSSAPWGAPASDLSSSPFGGDSSPSPFGDPSPSPFGAEPAPSAFGADPAPSAFSPEPAPAAEQSSAALGDLPLRVRGRSLRPEHQVPPSAPNSPVNGSRMLGDQSDRAGQGGGSIFEPPVAPLEESDSEVSRVDLPPAFFRGSRNQPDDEVEAPQDDQSDDSGWQSGPDNAWAPQQRGFNDDQGYDNSDAGYNGSDNGYNGADSGFNGTDSGFDSGGFNAQPSAFGAPAMPDAFRPDTEGNEHAGDEIDEVSDDQQDGAEDIEGREPPRLLGVWCDAGHVTSPDRSECRVCGLTVPPQAPILVARPPLGVLVFDNGDRIELDRPVVLGRDPKAQSNSADPEAPILHAVASSTGQVSRTHAEIRPSGWDVLLTDLGAMNGTALTLPGESPQAIEPGVPTAITPGCRVDLGGETGFVFEVEG
ncbi:hypothetical protein JCM9957A_30790 [Kineosporia succinea]